VDDDNDGVNDCTTDFCLGTPAGALVIQSGDFAGCTARQLKADAVEEYRDLSVDLLQAGTEVGFGEVLDVLFLLVNAREGIVQENFLFKTKPPETVLGDRSASADIDLDEGITFVSAKSGGLDDSATIASTDINVIVAAIVGFGLPGLTDPVLVEELLEVREVKVLEGSEVFEYQHTVFEKLDEFKGKKINGVLISNIPSILAEINFLQSKLVEDSRFLARVLLDNIDCSSLPAGSSERKECDLGEVFFTQGLNPGLPGPEKIDFDKKAWLQGVKVVNDLGDPFGDVARLT